MRTATASAAGPAFPSFSGMPGLIVSLGIVLDGAAVAAPGERRRPIAPTPLATSWAPPAHGALGRRVPKPMTTPTIGGFGVNALLMLPRGRARHRLPSDRDRVVPPVEPDRSAPEGLARHATWPPPEAVAAKHEGRRPSSPRVGVGQIARLALAKVAQTA